MPALSGLSNGHMPRMGAGCTGISLRLISFPLTPNFVHEPGDSAFKWNIKGTRYLSSSTKTTLSTGFLQKTTATNGTLWQNFWLICRPESPAYWAPPRVAYWDDRRCESPDYGIGSPKTPPIGKYITIQPRSIDTNARDERLLYNWPSFSSDGSLPLTKKRKGNNRYGQSGSQRCQRCQKGKRKVFLIFHPNIDYSVCTIPRMNRVNGV